ncbi:PQQ-dependent catabolism-associated CXXCW motif protein [Amaricoccus macauensis]|uniref:PQQ-dependent catabolism-associated CXXCW motif protein n=1 Tax=Amaricoccus macauensis TaxID=57001 RepID=UPI003C7C0A28
MKSAASSVLVAVFLVAAPVAYAVEEPQSYRMTDYRAPVPDTLAGATVIDTDAAYALWRTGRVAFIDALPRPPKPELPEGTIYREKPRDTIPGALWLANVGYGEIPEAMHQYFREGLGEATEGDLGAPVVLFCQADCWMSWNAAKRAVEYGYSNVFWFPEGTDGWLAAGHPTERMEPKPGGS